MSLKIASHWIAISMIVSSMATTLAGCGGENAKAVQEQKIIEKALTPEFVVTKRDKAVYDLGNEKIVFVGEQITGDKAFLVFRIDGEIQRIIHGGDIHIDAILSNGNKISLDEAEIMYPASGSTYFIYSTSLEAGTTIARIDTSLTPLNQSIVSTGTIYNQSYYLDKNAKGQTKIPVAIELQNKTLNPNITLTDNEKTVKIKRVDVTDKQVVITAGINYATDKKLERSIAALTFKNRGDILTEEHTDEFFAHIEKDISFSFSLPSVPLSKNDGAIRFTWEGLTVAINVNTGKEVVNTAEHVINLPIYSSDEGSSELERVAIQNKDDFLSNNAFIFKANALNTFDQSTNGYSETLLPYEIVAGNKFKKFSIRAKQILKKEEGSLNNNSAFASSTTTPKQKNGILVIYKDGKPFKNVPLMFDETQDLIIDIQGVHKVGLAFKLNKEQMRDNTDYYVLIRDGTLE